MAVSANPRRDRDLDVDVSLEESDSRFYTMLGAMLEASILRELERAAVERAMLPVRS